MRFVALCPLTVSQAPQHLTSRGDRQHSSRKFWRSKHTKRLRMNTTRQCVTFRQMCLFENNEQTDIWNKNRETVEITYLDVCDLSHGSRGIASCHCTNDTKLSCSARFSLFFSVRFVRCFEKDTLAENPRIVLLRPKTKKQKTTKNRKRFKMHHCENGAGSIRRPEMSFPKFLDISNWTKMKRWQDWWTGIDLRYTPTPVLFKNRQLTASVE